MVKVTLTHLIKYGKLNLKEKMGEVDMAKIETARERVSIDVRPDEHRQIKMFATLSGQTIREFVLESVRERMHREQVLREVSVPTKHLDTVPELKAIWENERDAAYDRL